MWPFLTNAFLIQPEAFEFSSVGLIIGNFEGFFKLKVEIKDKISFLFSFFLNFSNRFGVFLKLCLYLIS